MRKIGLWLALVTTAFSFGVIGKPTEAAQTRTVPLFGAWQGGEFDNDQTQKFDHCGAWVNYKSGIVLHVAVDRQYGWMLGFFDSVWNLAPGTFFPVVIMFDGASPWTGTARTIQPHFAILPMVKDSALINLFRGARQMTVSVGTQKFAFEVAPENWTGS